MSFVRLTELTSDREQFAIGVCDGKFGAHVGIVFHSADAGPSVLHFSGHLKVEADPLAVATANACWIVKVVDVPFSLGKQLVAIVRSIAVMKPRINYGLNLIAAKGSFDTSGTYTPQPGSDGLTCASFVSEIFDASALTLVDLVTWPQTLENIEWGNRVIRSLEKQGVSQMHLATLGQNNKGLRLHPFEVAAAAATAYVSWPLSFTQARAAAPGIGDTLKRLCPRGLRRLIAEFLPGRASCR